MDLFNHGYYWEAHEAWEQLWRAAERGTPEHDLLHGLILLAATGVKLREMKDEAACRHGSRAATFLRKAADGDVDHFDEMLGRSTASLASLAEHACQSVVTGSDPIIAFEFNLGLDGHLVRRGMSLW